jgi:hypothetical protein
VSGRLDYTVDGLREQIEAGRDRRVAAAEDACARDRDLAARRDEWRAEQEARVRRLARKLKDVPDNELGSFSIPQCPHVTYSWRTPEKRRDDEVAQANADADRALARLEAVKTANGTLSLTRNMLAEWFGL